MTTRLMAILLVFSLLLMACSKTEVVKLDAANGAPANSVQTNTSSASSVSSEPAAKEPAATTSTEGKTAVKCTDTDGDDVFTSGRVTVTYNDGSKKDFIDECPVNNEVFQTEYSCAGNDVKHKTNICDMFCVAGVCFQ